jgi:hypothetical protein
MHGKSVVFEPGYDPLEEENENMLLYYPVEHGFRNKVPNALLSEQERDYIRAAVFIPIQFEGHKDVIFLGLKREVSDIQGFVNTLDSL